jgi:hypothetical protein
MHYAPVFYQAGVLHRVTKCRRQLHSVRTGQLFVCNDSSIALNDTLKVLVIVCRILWSLSISALILHAVFASVDDSSVDCDSWIMLNAYPIASNLEVARKPPDSAATGLLYQAESSLDKRCRISITKIRVSINGVEPSLNVLIRLRKASISLQALCNPPSRTTRLS